MTKIVTPHWGSYALVGTWRILTSFRVRPGRGRSGERCGEPSFTMIVTQCHNATYVHKGQSYCRQSRWCHYGIFPVSIALLAVGKVQKVSRPPVFAKDPPSGRPPCTCFMSFAPPQWALELASNSASDCQVFTVQRLQAEGRMIKCTRFILYRFLRYEMICHVLLRIVSHREAYGDMLGNGHLRTRRGQLQHCHLQLGARRGSGRIADIRRLFRSKFAGGHWARALHILVDVSDRSRNWASLNDRRAQFITVRFAQGWLAHWDGL